MAPEPSSGSIFTRPRPARARAPRPPRVRPAPAADELPLWLRRVRVEVLLWAFHQGRPVDAAALTAVLGAKHARDDEPFAHWSREAVRELLWVDIARWCEQRGVPAPPAGATALWTVLDRLADLDGFGPHSDPLPLLREPLVDSGGVDRAGGPKRSGRSGKGRPPSKRQSSRHPSQR